MSAAIKRKMSASGGESQKEKQSLPKDASDAELVAPPTKLTANNSNEVDTAETDNNNTAKASLNNNKNNSDAAIETSKESEISPPQDKAAPAEKSKQNWKYNLRVLISNLYMTTERRLPGARAPRCLHNTSFCVNNHRRAILPNAPTFKMSQALRSTLNGQHYQTFLGLLEEMVMQRVFPGEAVFDRLVDMVMVLIAKSLTIEELKGIYVKVVRIFQMLLTEFPPCWTALRPYYLSFLGIVQQSRDQRTKQSKHKLEFYLDLLEQHMPKCSDRELGELTPYYEEHVFNYSEEEDQNMSADTVFLRHVQEYDWLSGNLCLDDFESMSAPVRLARLFEVLDMLSLVLETDFLMWLDHNKLCQAESKIFQDETSPFAVLVFDLTPSSRLTNIGRQLMRLYSAAVARSLEPSRLQTLERLISLLIEVSNTAELEYVDNAVRFPYLGPQTRRLIADFFKIFKTNNPRHISSYLKMIPLFSQPYVCYEFADQFLQLFYFSKKLPFCPEKVCEEFKHKHWLKYRARREIEDEDADEQLSREDYLGLMLQALRNYCEWRGLALFWQYLKSKKPVALAQTYSSSPLATPAGVVSGDVGKIFMLDEMEKEAHSWKQRIQTKVLVNRPRVNLPVAKIRVYEMCECYGEDLRQLRYMRRLLRDEVARLYREVDVSDWVSYLDEFLGEDEPAMETEAI